MFPVLVKNLQVTQTNHYMGKGTSCLRGFSALESFCAEGLGICTMHLYIRYYTNTLPLFWGCIWHQTPPGISTLGTLLPHISVWKLSKLSTWRGVAMWEEMVETSGAVAAIFTNRCPLPEWFTVFLWWCWFQIHSPTDGWSSFPYLRRMRWTSHVEPTLGQLRQQRTKQSRQDPFNCRWESPLRVCWCNIFFLSKPWWSHQF